MTFDLHFTAEDWARIERDWTAWWAGALDRPLVMIEGRGADAPPPERWLPELRRIREGGKLCQLYVTAEGALEIVRGLGGRGFALCVSEAMSAEEAEDFLSLLGREGSFYRINLEGVLLRRCKCGKWDMTRAEFSSPAE